MILRNTSITLTELDNLKKEDPERFWEFYYWILIEKLEEKKRIEELKDQNQDTGDKDTGIIREENETDNFYSEIIKGSEIDG